MNDLITNGTEIKQRIVSEINNAKQCIHVAMAWFTGFRQIIAGYNTRNRVILTDNAKAGDRFSTPYAV